jgi:hypothetical protein
MNRSNHPNILSLFHEFRPHLPEKYDRSANPTEFLQIYTTSILAAGGNEAVMTN